MRGAVDVALAPITFGKFLADRGIELAGLSETVVRRLVEEFKKQRAAGNIRTELADMEDAPGSRGTPQARPEEPSVS